MVDSAVSLECGSMIVATRDGEILPEVRAMVSELGVECDVVGRGQDILEKVLSARGRFHVRLLLLDDDLPDVSGGSLLGHLKEADPGLKVIFMAGKASAGLEMQVRREGVSFFLHKPVDPGILMKVISRAVEHETSRIVR